MMNRKKEILGLFATPLYTNTIPAHLSTACNVFEKAEMLTEKPSRGEYGVHSKNTYIMNEPGCA